MISKKGKMIITEEVELPEGKIANVQDSYKYLGTPQANGNHEEAAKKFGTAKSLCRIRQALRCQLNCQNQIQAVNTYALPFIRYHVFIIYWPKEKIEATDIKTRKLLTMHGEFPSKSSTLRLHTKWKVGGRGLVSIRAPIQDETKIQEYIRMMSLNDDLLSDMCQAPETQ